MKPSSQAASAPDAGGSRRDLRAGLALVLLVALVFAGTLAGEFLWDDDRNVTANGNMHGLAGLVAIWTAPHTSQQYYPLTHTTFWMQAQLSGIHPAPFHALNVLLQAAAAVLLWRVLRRLTVPGAWLAAAVFAIHPLQVESVAWITERKNLLSGALYFASALVFLRWAGIGDARPAGAGDAPPADRGRARRQTSFALAFALFCCGMLAKTAIVTLPFVLAVVLWWKRGRLSRADVLALLPFVAVGAALSGVTAVIEWGRVGASGPDWDLALPARLVLAGRVGWFYLAKLVAPVGLVFIYPRWTIDAGAPLQWIAPLAAVALAAALWALRARIGRGPLAALLCFALTLGPVSGLLRFYFQVYSYVQDHFQYLACVDPIALAVALCARTFAGVVEPRVSHAALPYARAAGAALLLVPLGALSAARVPVLHDSRTLWTTTLRDNPGAWMAALNLAQLQLEDGAAEAALASARLARATPHRHHDEAWFAEGLALAALGRKDEAAAAQRRALELKPDAARAHLALARLLAEAGHDDEAVTHYRGALATPGAPRAEALDGLAAALERLGRRADAGEARAQAAKIGAGPFASRFERGLAFARQERWADAAAEFAAARSLAPRDVTIVRAFANALVEAGRLDEAERAYTDGRAAFPQDAALLEGHGLLRARAGRHAEALALFDEAARAGAASATLHYNRGLSLEALARADDAAAAYREAIRRDAKLAPPHNNLAILLYFKHDLAGARAELQRFRELGGTPHPDFVKALGPG